MNMDVDYMVHKSRIQQQLQEAAQAASRKQKQEDKEAKTGKNKVAMLLTSVVKIVIATK